MILCTFLMTSSRVLSTHGQKRYLCRLWHGRFIRTRGDVKNQKEPHSDPVVVIKVGYLLRVLSTQSTPGSVNSLTRRRGTEKRTETSECSVPLYRDSTFSPWVGWSKIQTLFPWVLGDTKTSKQTILSIILNRWLCQLYLSSRIKNNLKI